MLLWTAFLLGLAGSLHCAGMCGPLLLALPRMTASGASGPGHGHTAGSPPGLLAARLAYNAGRLLTYTAIGALLGLLGHSLALAGLQRWVSIAAGAAIFAGLLTSSRFAVGGPVPRLVNQLKASLGRLLTRRGLVPQFGLGLLNGLLPCGLVYAAGAGATAAGTAVDGLAYMAAFGLGTVPMMLAIGLAGPRVQWNLRFRLQRLVPVSLAVVATLLILRGLALGIPYLSPDLVNGALCH